ncbi:DUF6382 domain-containing protein [Paenibacillus dokdonensis]|uniref:DUF6382 domain-containing protein n=1 Tax=Paenibacillus dokdonensis TaxID=2567944 RepID=A0ABU6GI46_9BACL|nr:DUF6382 domain-containing protein [Paenibacillus dokdonensis]MEC0239415.1 DUF6382 domain-containing protein [Paenibacillus dokdonensis]
MLMSGTNGIRSDELSKVEVSMISASRIPRFLPLHVQEVDLQVTLRYDMTEKKMLSHMLKGERINMTEYYSLLLQVAETLEESVMYMLQPGKYALEEDYIFVDGSLQEGTLYLTYIPLERTECFRSVSDSLKELVTRFMASVTELSGGGVQQLLQFTASEEFTVSGFKKLLLRLLSRAGEVRMNSAVNVKPEYISEPDHVQASAAHARAGGSKNTNHAYQGPQQAEMNSPALKGRTERVNSENHEDSAVELALRRSRSSTAAEAFPMLSTSRNKPNPNNRDDDPEVPAFLKSWNGYGSRTEEDIVPDEEREQGPASSRRIYIALGCLLMAAIVWRMIYMPAPSSGKMIVCLLLTVILGIAAVLSWVGRLFAPKNTGAASTPFNELPDFGSTELSADSKPSKGNTRFEIEQLTGFFKGSMNKGMDKPSELAGIDHDPEPDWKWKFPPSQSDQRMADERESGIGKNEADNGTRISAFNQRIWNHAGVNSDSDAPDTDIAERDYYSRLGQKTEILNSGKGGATVLLSNTVSGENGASDKLASVCYLLRDGEGETRTERIELRQQHFVIGRSVEVAQYVENSVGASRAHVELSRTEDGGYQIKDLGSKNGTRLMGEMLVPYKEYPLHDGDNFIIVKGAYTFRSA